MHWRRTWTLPGQRHYVTITGGFGKGLYTISSRQRYCQTFDEASEQTMRKTLTTIGIILRRDVGKSIAQLSALFFFQLMARGDSNEGTRKKQQALHFEWYSRDFQKDFLKTSRHRQMNSIFKIL